MKTSIFGKNLTMIVVAILIVTIVFVFAAINVSDRLMVESSAKVLLKTAELAATMLKPPETDPLAVARQVATSTGYRVTLIGTDGTVVADSGTSPDRMENHLSRPEVQAALTKKSGTAVRKSATTGIRMLYVAILVQRAPFPASLQGEKSTRKDLVLRLAMPLTLRTDSLLKSQQLLIYFILFVAALSVLISVILNRQLASPVAALREKAETYAKNSGTQALPPLTLPQELKSLDASLDSMVEQIRRRSAEKEEMGRLYSSILESAGEGIVAVDSSLRIIETNPAFGRLFGAKREEIVGHTLTEATGDNRLPEIFTKCLTDRAEVFSEMSLFRAGGQRFKVHASPLVQPGEQVKVVAVISDVTELTRLEKIRTDFVANVSHELRTPIQVIQGYTEILLDDAAVPEDKKKYLSIIEHNSRRMERIVSDLLMLSRIEGSPSTWLTVENCSAAKIIDSAVASILPRAERKGITVPVRMERDINFIANPGLVEQALVNLLDNALQYSPPGSHVEVSCVEEGDRVAFSVKDHGAGIPAADLEHIFERFYRVDKSRNRNTGGTGLGLAIVKHIATAHEGEVEAKSYVQEGSIFTVRLPVGGPRAALRPDGGAAC